MYPTTSFRISSFREGGLSGAWGAAGGGTSTGEADERRIEGPPLVSVAGQKRLVKTTSTQPFVEGAEALRVFGFNNVPHGAFLATLTVTLTLTNSRYPTKIIQCGGATTTLSFTAHCDYLDLPPRFYWEAVHEPPQWPGDTLALVTFNMDFAPSGHPHLLHLDKGIAIATRKFTPASWHPPTTITPQGQAHRYICVLFCYKNGQDIYFNNPGDPLPTLEDIRAKGWVPLACNSFTFTA